MFRFRLDASSGVPPYLQMVHQVRQSLLLGYLQQGDQLPTVKEAAAELAVNPNTVVKAYRQLDLEGLVTARPGAGTFVTGPSVPVAPGAHAKLRRALEHWLRDAHTSGFDDEAITALIAIVRHNLATEGAA